MPEKTPPAASTIGKASAPPDAAPDAAPPAARRFDDLELEPNSAEEEDRRSSAPDYQITTYPTDFTLEILHKKWEDGEIEIPRFQRGFVWTKTQASRLIDSFLLGLPVPAIFLYSEHGSDKYLVIDGQQRLRSVFSYFDGRFPPTEVGNPPSAAQDNGSVFRLVGLPSSRYYQHFDFHGLPERDRRRLRNAVLRAFIVKQIDPDDDASMYDIFERLNNGGTHLENQEIRQCIYRGPFADLLEELNELESWRVVIGQGAPDSRMRDIELIVRFFATRSLDTYEKPMKRFLSLYMAHNRHAPAQTLSAHREVFEVTCTAVARHLGEKPFHRRSGLLSVSAMDAVMVAFSKNLGRIPNDIRTRFERLLHDDDFCRNTTQRTTDSDRLRGRFEQASRSLFHS